MNFKERFLNWLFTSLFGDFDVNAEINVTAGHILIAELTIKTRFGTFTFPFLNKHLPIPEIGNGYEIAGHLADESPFTRPA